jgi:hypothetical protein
MVFKILFNFFNFIIIYLGTWNLWYSIHCVLEKKRKLINGTIETLSINITNLELCDNLDPYYTMIKSKQIKEIIAVEVQQIKTDVDKKLNKLENQNIVFTKVAYSFSWLAILVIFLIILIFVLNDMFRLISFLKKSYSNRPMKRQSKMIIPEIVVLKEAKMNHFKQVCEKEKKLFNKQSYLHKKTNTKKKI